MDKNKDNFVSKKEMKEFFKDKLKLDTSLDDVKTFSEYCDKNNDDKIAVYEFIATLKAHAQDNNQVGYRKLWEGEKGTTKTVS